MLFVYELFNLWADPWATGLMIVGYFIAAFAVDFLFKRASFCKYVCPVGQFNFLASTLSPLEVAMRDPNARTTCRTKAVGGAVSLGQTINRFTRSLVPFASLLIAWRISGDFAPKNRVRACWPWAFVIVLLFATACWTMSQPMDMRGTFVS